MAIASAPSGDILTFDSGPLQARIFQGSGHLALAGPDLAGTPHANVLTFEPPVVTVGGRAQTVGRVVSSSPLPDGFELVQDLGGTNITARLTFPADGVLRYEVTDWNGPLPDQTSVSAASDDGEHFYGFGEKFDTFDQAGRFVRTQTFDHPGNKGDRSYKTAPWFLSTRGYGFYLESSTESHFDMRSGSRDGYVVTNLFSTLRFNIVYGPRLTDALSRYTGLTGRPSLPPPFAFGPWISSDVWRTGGEVRYAVEKFRQADVNIPASAFVFDSPWESNYNDFNFNLKGPGTQLFDGGTFKGKPFTLEGKSFPGFATVDEMMDFFRGHGLKVILWMTPFVNVSSDTSEVAGQEPGKARNYDEGEKTKGVFPLDRDGKALLVNWWKGVGSPVDFTTPVGRDWVTKQIEALVESSEVVTRSGAREPVIGGFKTDDGESLTDPGANKNKEGVYIPLDARYADGRTGRELRNAYCVGYHETIHGVLGQKGVLLARSGFTGSQAFPGYWAGDNEPNFGPENGLPSVITAGMSAAMSGFSIWGHDVGGYQNNNFSHSPADLFRRWAQFGCFSPLMQMHRQVNPDDLRQYPWGYPEGGKNTALENYQFYSRLHIQLFPYIYTYANESSTTGLPILRPLVLLNQDDPQTFTVDDTYHFGNEFLVAPVIELERTARTVYLPGGQWYDYWTQALHAGGQFLAWSNPDPTKLPLFVRRGAIVPMLPDGVQTLCDANFVNNPAVATWDGSLNFLVYPADASRFTVYDGTQVVCQSAGGVTEVTLTSVPRAITLKVLAPRPSGVKRDGTDQVSRPSLVALDAADTGWFFDAASRFVLVKFSHPGGTTRVTF